MSTVNLTELEIQALRCLNGEESSFTSWGAALGACCEYLRSVGFAAGSYHITETGKKYLKDLDVNR